MNERPDTLDWLPALRAPALATAWSTARWERAIRLIRRARLLGRMARAVEEAGLLERVPPAPQRVLRAEIAQSRWWDTVLQWATVSVGSTLQDAPYPKLLLKGGAYAAQQMAFARGRVASDLDILVAREHVFDARDRLAAARWAHPPMLDHDRRYYEEWSHELPPLQHDAHALELDLHHNILPPVSRDTIDAQVLIDAAVPSPLPGWRVLQPVDQIIHAATHLYFDSDPVDRVRDLHDIDQLIDHWSGQPLFWSHLLERAASLRVQAPLGTALHFVALWFDRALPAPARSMARRLGSGVPAQLLRKVLTPPEPDGPPQRGAHAAATLILLRYHLWRMPPTMLAGHLWHKWRRGRGAIAQNIEPQDRR